MLETSRLNARREIFSIGAVMSPSQLRSEYMTDPTEMILTGGFVLALGIFVIAALAREISARKPGLPPEARVMGTDSPCQAPAGTSLPPPLPPRGGVPVWFYRPLDLAGAGFVFLVFAWLSMASLPAGQGKEPVLGPEVLLVNIGFQFVMAGVVAVLVLTRVTPDAWAGLRWRAWPQVLLIAPAAVFLMWVVFGGLQLSGYVKWMESLGAKTVQDTVLLLQNSKDPLVLGLMVFAAVIVAPLCEEIVFRGYFYPVLKKFAGIWPAAFSSALVFAVAHGNLTAVLPLFLFGGLLVFIYEKTGSLWAPIAVHFCFNSATVAVQIAARFYDIPIQPTP